MAKNEAIAKAIATDPYLKDRKSPTAVDQQLSHSDLIAADGIQSDGAVTVCSNGVRSEIP